MEVSHRLRERCGRVFKAPDPAVCTEDGIELRPLAARLPERGELIGKHYRVNKKVGDGGMCAIYSATDLTNDTEVAVKVLHPELATEPGQSESMLYEVSLSLSLDDENLVRCYDGGISRNGFHFMVMDLLEGRTLAQLLAIRGRVCMEDAAEIFIGAARACTRFTRAAMFTATSSRKTYSSTAMQRPAQSWRKGSS